MSDPFKNRTPSLNGPATDLSPVTPSDTTDLETVAVALYIEGAGTLSLETQKNETRTVAVGDFAILPVGVRRVNATGTTATGIHAFIVG
ncbi:MAG: hypothetical protein HWE33_02435 [Rhodobacteraceae bacterium]|uniref:spike base protein, RCAP_Rcc01079 family n=1 Tax=Celeribacter sp. HF31 TaxID=2721558 RepID=UPI001431A906|nr:hypothetical protein [Celeribacter sp. HF31]NIY80916.1 hypothetical protein [Celeribacter sp. HF31]NVK45135.1 hypothetical protein [Paracoccaceae bacterium]